MAFASTSTEFALLDSRTASGAFVLPVSSAIPGRILNIKDPYGTFTRSSITVYTAGGDTFEDGTTFRVLNCAYDSLQVYAGSTTMWYITGGTYQNFDTATVSVISTIQTFNWASLCNSATTGYETRFNPAAYGRISLLDNVFTSSVATKPSTFIEFGNLNALPGGNQPGSVFRWMFGVESSPQPSTGVSLKVKRWISFSNANSNAYGANLSTLQDVTIWDNVGQVQQQPTLIHGGPLVLSTIGPGTTATPGIMRFINGGTSFIQFAQSMGLGATGSLTFSGINTVPGAAVTISTGTATNTLDVNGNTRTISLSTQQIFTSSLYASVRIHTSALTVAAPFTALFSTFGPSAAANITLGLAAGDAYKPVGTTWLNVSDKRIKENIQDADLNLCYENVSKLKLRRFNYVSSFIEETGPYDRSVLGFIAQETSPILPKSVVKTDGYGLSDLLVFNVDQVNMTAFGALKKTIADKEALESTTFSLQTLNTDLQNRISTLEGLVINLSGGNV